MNQLNIPKYSPNIKPRLFLLSIRTIWILIALFLVIFSLQRLGLNSKSHDLKESSQELDLRFNQKEELPPAINLTENNLLLLPDAEYLQLVLQKIREAKENIKVALFIFRFYKDTDAPAKISKELIKAAKRGIEVEVFLEKASEKDWSLNQANLKVAKKLQAGGVKVYFDTEQERSHLKAVVIDHCWVFLGSHNFTQSSLLWNHELSVLIHSEKLASQIEAYLYKLQYSLWNP